jgi:hypothetical protein
MAIVYTNPYEQPYLAAKKELEQRLLELDMIQRRIAWLQNAITALDPANVSTAPALQYGNLADLCFAVLSSNPGKPMSVPEIRQVIASMGIRLQYSNASAVLHTTLRRESIDPKGPVKITYDKVPGLNGEPTPTAPTKFMWDPAFPSPSQELAFHGEM